MKINFDFKDIKERPEHSGYYIVCYKFLSDTNWFCSSLSYSSKWDKWNVIDESTESQIEETEMFSKDEDIYNLVVYWADIPNDKLNIMEEKYESRG